MKLMEDNVARAVSTNVDQTYLRGGFLGKTSNRLKDLLNLDEEPDHRFNKDWIDPFHPNLRKLKRISRRDMTPVIYTGQKITSLSNEMYGTTSLWWLVLYVSGYAHPHEVPHGATLYFPQLKTLTEIFNVAPKSKRGTVVRT